MGAGSPGRGGSPASRRTGARQDRATEGSGRPGTSRRDDDRSAPRPRSADAPAGRADPDAPLPPQDADPRELPPDVRAELRTLSKPAAEEVGRHLAAAGRLIDDNPELALRHARAARSRAARLASVREAVGVAAYRSGEWTEALAELRAARRISGDASQLPLMADAERALGRPERAVEAAGTPEARALPAELRAELRIVAAGARRDMGQLDAALLALREAGATASTLLPWSARLRYAYADTLLAAGRGAEAREWFQAAALADTEDSTDAVERLLELDGVTLIDDADDDDAGGHDDQVGGPGGTPSGGTPSDGKPSDGAGPTPDDSGRG